MSHYEIVCKHSDLDEETINKILLYEIDMNDRIIEIDNYIIKNIPIDKITDKLNTEILLIQKYLSGDFVQPHFLNYHLILSVIEKKLKKSNSFDYITKLTEYKNKISPNLINKDIKKTNKIYDYIVVMPKYQKLSLYLSDTILNDNIILTNIIGILDLSILIRDKYSLIHCDVKVCNIVVNNNIFYLIDWEDAFNIDDVYYQCSRPKYGNTEMYPHYDSTSEQFFIYSIGVLIIRIIGYNFDVTYKDFMKDITFNYILSKIPIEYSRIYEHVLLDIYNKKYNKIEELRSSIKEILDNI